MLKKYEAMFIFENTLKDEALEGVHSRIREEIEKLGGSCGDVATMGKRQFARPMKKKDSGQYVRMPVTIDLENVSPLLTRFKFNEGIFRVQIISDDSEDVVVEAPEAKATDESAE